MLWFFCLGFLVFFYFLGKKEIQLKSDKYVIVFCIQTLEHIFM